MDAMQKKLMKTVKGLREDGVDLKETPVVFTWFYPEEPWIKFELMIQETDEIQVEEEETAH
jgi:hypothetical protein